jgi:hypothetical protein
MMGRAILRDLESGKAFRVYFDNGRVTQAMRNYPPTRYEMLDLYDMNPLGTRQARKRTPLPRTTRGVESNWQTDVCETVKMLAVLALMLLAMGIVGGIERGTIPL